MAFRPLLFVLASLALARLLNPAGAIASDSSPAVVASIKPLHALVAGVMTGVGEPVLLLDGAQSPHTYALKPSDAAALENAARVFWLGPSLEGFLAKPLAALKPEASVEIGLRLGERVLPSRPEKAPEPEHHDDEHAHAQEHEEEHGHSHVDADGSPVPDLHVWLDPKIAQVMVDVIATELAAADPEHATQYRENAVALQARLAALDRELEAELAPVRTRPFIVFHDAYQYFGRRYGLAWAGSLSVSPEHPPGARHLTELREQIEAGKAVCVFAEPQFDGRMVERLVEGTGAKAATLDPDGGAGLSPGPDAYFTLMRELAGTLRRCLAG